MANIRSLPSGNWNAQVRLKGEPQRSKTFPTEVEALAWASEQEAVTKHQKTHTIYTLGMAYRESHLKGRGSYNHSLVIIKQLAQSFPDPIHEITARQVNDFKLMRLKVVRPSSCRTQLAFMSRFFRYAKRELLIDIPNPVADIALPAPSKPSEKVVSKHELEELLAELSPTMATVVELAYETAMRRSEIIKLTMSCLHLEERIADVVDGKTGTRNVPLTRRAVDLLELAVSRCRDATNPLEKLFKVKPHSASTAVKRARRKLGLPETVRIHQLRHTRITNVARKGLNNAQIMIVSGHRDPRSVARYTHLNARDVLHLID